MTHVVLKDMSGVPRSPYTCHRDDRRSPCDRPFQVVPNRETKKIGQDRTEAPSTKPWPIQSPTSPRYPTPFVGHDSNSPRRTHPPAPFGLLRPVRPHTSSVTTVPPNYVVKPLDHTCHRTNNPYNFQSSKTYCEWWLLGYMLKVKKRSTVLDRNQT